jgi:hypothetical protein
VVLTPAAVPSPIPAHVLDDTGASWTVTRAWPGADGAATFEATSPASPHVRGGRITASGALLAPLATDPRLPALAELAALGTVVVHRPGRRAVIRTADGTRFIKVVRPGRAYAVVDAAGRGVAFRPAFRVPDVVVSTPDAVHYEAVSGRTLHSIGADPTVSEDIWSGVWAAWATAWCATMGDTRASVAVRQGSAVSSADHTAEAEAEVVRTWAAHAQTLPMPAAERLGLVEVAARVEAKLLTGAADPLVMSHRDLHDKQVLWDAQDGLALLDLDTVTRAEAALDLGNLAAHLEWRRQQGLWSATRTKMALHAVDAVADTLGVSPQRFAVYKASAQFRIACVYAFRPRWAELARDTRLDLMVQSAGTGR